MSVGSDGGIFLEDIASLFNHWHGLTPKQAAITSDEHDKYYKRIEGKFQI